MRTITEFTEGEIAVHAKDTIPWWEMIYSQPLIKSTAASFCANLFAVCITSAIDMVDRQKFKIGFITTRTVGTTVSFKGFPFESIHIKASSFLYFSLMCSVITMLPVSAFLNMTSPVLFVIGSSLFLMSLVIGSAMSTLLFGSFVRHGWSIT